jgi:hypothetical protein
MSAILSHSRDTNSLLHRLRFGVVLGILKNEFGPFVTTVTYLYVLQNIELGSLLCFSDQSSLDVHVLTID